MKKAIVLLLALTVIGGAVFAEDAALAVSGYVTSGIKVVNNSAGTTFGVYSDDWGTAETTAFIDASYTGEMAGFDVALLGGSSSGFALDTAYGWISPFAGLKLIAGNYYGGAFDGVDDDSNDYFANEGVFATYSVAGLTAGAGVAPDLVANGHPDFVFGAAYMMEDMFKFRFSGNTASNEIDAMAASVSVLAVPNLTLTAGYLSTAMATSAVDWIDATVGYKVTDALSAKVVFYDYLAAEYMYVAPRVTYMITDALTVYAQVAIYTEGANAVTNYATIKPRGYMAY
jgi:hypothetical protein